MGQPLNCKDSPTKRHFWEKIGEIFKKPVTNAEKRHQPRKVRVYEELKCSVCGKEKTKLKK